MSNAISSILYFSLTVPVPCPVSPIIPKRRHLWWQTPLCSNSTKRRLPLIATLLTNRQQHGHSTFYLKRDCGSDPYSPCTHSFDPLFPVPLPCASLTFVFFRFLDCNSPCFFPSANFSTFGIDSCNKSEELEQQYETNKNDTAAIKRRE